MLSSGQHLEILIFLLFSPFFLSLDFFFDLCWKLGISLTKNPRKSHKTCRIFTHISSTGTWLILQCWFHLNLVLSKLINSLTKKYMRRWNWAHTLARPQKNLELFCGIFTLFLTFNSSTTSSQTIRTIWPQLSTQNSTKSLEFRCTILHEMERSYNFSSSAPFRLEYVGTSTNEMSIIVWRSQEVNRKKVEKTKFSHTSNGSGASSLRRLSYPHYNYIRVHLWVDMFFSSLLFALARWNSSTYNSRCKYWNLFLKRLRCCLRDWALCTGYV